MVVSKVKTLKTKTYKMKTPFKYKDPLENEDPLENKDPLENEDPLVNEDPLNQTINQDQIKSNTIKSHKTTK